MPDDQQQEPSEFAKACEELFEKVKGIAQEGVIRQLNMDTLTSRLPAGFNVRNDSHRDMVMYGVELGVKAAVFAVIKLGTTVVDEDDEKAEGDE